jgi:transposase
MGHCIGIDLHKATSYVTTVDETGRILEQRNLRNEPETLRAYFAAQPADARLVVEATGHWMWLYELLEDRYPDLVLAHPLKTKAIASARIKTDKLDSTVLAQLLRADLIPTAYIPPRAVRDTRELLRYRAALVSLRTVLKNRVAAIVRKTGVKLPTKTTVGVKSRRVLATAPVRSCYRLALDGWFRLLDALTTEIREATTTIDAQCQADPQAQLLRTIPGIGAYAALLILSEIGEVHRFPDSRHLCSYAGLVPSVHASGGKTRLGRLTKQGSKWLRWILVETSIHAVNGAPQFRSLYWRVQRKHGTNTARVAVARAVLKTIYAMLKAGQPFEARPRRLAVAG